MNRRNKIAVILVVLFSVLTFWSVVHNRRATIRESLRDFAVADTGSITKIFLADRDNHQVTLQKVKPGRWKVNDKYIAMNEQINTLLFTIKALEVKEPVGKKARENVTKQLAAKSVKIEIYNGEELIKVYYVGGDTQDHLGTYMLLTDEETGENSSIPFVMYIPGFDGFLNTRYMTTEADWRDRLVFDVMPTQIRSVKVEFTETPEASFELSVIGRNNFQLKQLKANTPAPFDTMAVKQYLSYYNNINYEALLNDVYKKITIDSIVRTPCAYSIEVTDTSGHKTFVKMYHRPAQPDEVDEKTGEPRKYDIDRLFAFINDDRDFVLIQYYSFGKLLQPVEYFRGRKGRG